MSRYTEPPSLNGVSLTMNVQFLKPMCCVVLTCFSRVWFFATPWTVVWRPPLSMYFPGMNTGEGWHAFLQAIFPTQGLNPSLLHLLHRQVGSLPLVSPGTLYRMQKWQLDCLLSPHISVRVSLTLSSQLFCRGCILIYPPCICSWDSSV